MTSLDIMGKDRQELDELLQHQRRKDLLDIIYSLATLEPHFSVKTFADRRQLTPASVLRLIHDGKLAASLPIENGYRIPLSAIRDFDRRAAYSKPRANGEPPP